MSSASKFVCKYCHSKFSAKCNLNYHQNTAKYCLDSRKASGDDVKISKHICDCGSEFTQKFSLIRHMKKCGSCTTPNKSPVQINNVNNARDINNINNINNGSITNNNITNNINLSYGFPLSELTPEFLEKELVPFLTSNIVAQGVGKMTEITAFRVLNKDGKWCIVCRDKARNRLKYLEMKNKGLSEMDDFGGKKLTSVLQPHFSNAVMNALVETSSNSELFNPIASTAQTIKDLGVNNKPLRDVLVQLSPTELDDLPEASRLQFAEAKRLGEQKTAELDKLLCKITQERALSEHINRVKFLMSEWFTGKTIRRKGIHDKQYWHRQDKYVFTLIPVSQDKPAFLEIDGTRWHAINLIGYANSDDGVVIDFGEKELKAIETLGFTCWLDVKYPERTKLAFL